MGPRGSAAVLPVRRRTRSGDQHWSRRLRGRHVFMCVVPANQSPPPHPHPLTHHPPSHPPPLLLHGCSPRVPTLQKNSPAEAPGGKAAVRREGLWWGGGGGLLFGSRSVSGRGQSAPPLTCFFFFTVTNSDCLSPSPLFFPPELVSVCACRGGGGTQPLMIMSG